MSDHLAGHVDDQLRPVVRLPFLSRDRDDDQLLTVDTGCTLKLVISDRRIAQALGMRPTAMTLAAVVASGATHDFQVFEATVGWLGTPRRVRVYVPIIDEADLALRRVMPDEPIGVIGTEMLLMTELVINFVTRALTISRAETPLVHPAGG